MKLKAEDVRAYAKDQGIGLMAAKRILMRERMMKIVERDIKDATTKEVLLFLLRAQ